MTVRVDRIPEHPSPHGGRLGRHVEHDERSRAFAAGLGLIHTVSHRRYGAIFDQGELGSCTALTQKAVLKSAVRRLIPAHLGSLCSR